MNYKLFIEYENESLSSLCKRIYDLFLENNYDVILLDNTLSFTEKEQIIKESNKKNIIVSNKVNDNNTIEIVYSIKDTNELAISLNNALNPFLAVSKYYQKRDNNTTNIDYYQILRDIKNNESIIIFYPPSSINNQNIASLVYQGINNYLNEQNIYTVKSGDTIYAIAKKYNITVDELKDANNLINNNLSIGQKLFIPDSIPKEETNEELNIIYIVKSGDSLYAIARNNNTTVDELKRLNNLTSNTLSIGQKIILPSTSNSNYYIVKSGDSLYAVAKKYNTTVDELKRLNNLTSNTLSIGQKIILPSTSNSDYYIVKSGDSLYAIAKKYNTTVDELKRLNSLTSNTLSIGQKLLLS